MYAKSTRPSAKREVQKERSATIESRALGALKLASEARDENVPAKRADFFLSQMFLKKMYVLLFNINSLMNPLVFPKNIFV